MQKKKWLTHGTVLVHLVVHCIFSLFASKPFNIYYLLFYNAFALMTQRLYSFDSKLQFFSTYYSRMHAWNLKLFISFCKTAGHRNIISSLNPASSYFFSNECNNSFKHIVSRRMSCEESKNIVYIYRYPPID